MSSSDHDQSGPGAACKRCHGQKHCLWYGYTIARAVASDFAYLGTHTRYSTTYAILGVGGASLCLNCRRQLLMRWSLLYFLLGIAPPLLLLIAFWRSGDAILWTTPGREKYSVWGFVGLWALIFGQLFFRRFFWSLFHVRDFFEDRVIDLCYGDVDKRFSGAAVVSDAKTVREGTIVMFSSRGLRRLQQGPDA
jgi:hypothetical protein